MKTAYIDFCVEHLILAASWSANTLPSPDDLRSRLIVKASHFVWMQLATYTGIVNYCYHLRRNFICGQSQENFD